MPATTTTKPAAPAASVPASAPSSPLFLRTKKGGGAGLPITPQRQPRAANTARLPQTQQPVRTRNALLSPATPASGHSSPHTPGLSNLSIASSDTSILHTPSHSAAAPASLGPSLQASPELVSRRPKAQSTADDADNWRARANQNGIKVSSVDSQFEDDEIDCENASPTRPSARLPSEAGPLPASFLSTHRRARSTTAQNTLNQSAKTSSVVPEHLKTPDRRGLATISALNTPPPKANILHKLKLKGVSTEPPQPRRRDPYGPTAAELFDIDEDDYNPYPHSFTGVQPIGSQLGFNDPFNLSLASITESPSPFVGEDSILEPDHPEPRRPLSCSVCDTAASRIAILEPCKHPLCSACLTSALNIVGEKDMQCAVCSMSVQDFKLQSEENIAPSLGPTSTPPTKQKKLNAMPIPFDVEHDSLNPFAFFEAPQGISTPPMRPARAGETIVLRIDNVPWDITPPAISNWLKQPVVRVHVLLDRKGKTLSHAYVELATEEIAKAALRGAQNSVLGRGKRARGVTVTRSTQEELMRALFPSWQGGFEGAKPALNGLTHEQVMAALDSGIITEAELNSLLHLIRSPDSHFLKVPSLPFHSLVSILSKFPADADSRVFWSTSLRDNIFDVTSAAIQVMLPRVKDNQTPENLELLSQLLMAATSCQAFTHEQVRYLAELAQHAPSQLQGLIPPPVPQFVPSAPPAPPRSIPQPQHHIPLTSLPALNMGNFGPMQLNTTLPAPQPYRTPQMHQLPMQMQMAPPSSSFVGMQPMQPPVQPMFRDFQLPAMQQFGHGMGSQPVLQPQGIPGPSPLDALAREFGVDAGLIEALAQRLSGMR